MYRINYSRVIMTLVLFVAVIALGVCLLIEGIQQKSVQEAFVSRFEALCMTQMPKSSEGGANRCVVLDPGHGGQDAGASAGDVNEKDVNLAVCLEAEQRLRALGYTVLLTRCDDSDVDTMAAVQEANDEKVDLFVAVHQNAMENDTLTHGIETWYLPKDDYSLILAQCLQTAAVEATGAKDLGVKNTQSFMVTRETLMPSALIETGFLTEETERANLTSDAYQQKLAQAIVDAVEEFFEQAQLPASEFDFTFGN